MTKATTGYQQLRKTKKIASYYCSSQGCASGTCDSYVAKKIKSRPHRQTVKVLLRQMVFERAA